MPACEIKCSSYCSAWRLAGSRSAPVKPEALIGGVKAMKKILGTMFAVTLMAGMSTVASAQNKDKTSGSYESKSTNTTSTDTGTTKTTADTYYGKIEEYQAGKSIKITT